MVQYTLILLNFQQQQTNLIEFKKCMEEEVKLVISNRMELTLKWNLVFNKPGCLIFETNTMFDEHFIKELTKMKIFYVIWPSFGKFQYVFQKSSFDYSNKNLF